MHGTVTLGTALFRAAVRLIGALALLALLVTTIGCGEQPGRAEPPSCAAGTLATCSGPTSLTLCVDGAPLVWDCAATCAADGQEGRCESRGAAPADCVCVRTDAVRAAACPPPGRVEDGACLCDGPERTCVPDAGGGPSRAISFCADGAVQYRACHCAEGDVPSCELGPGAGQATCRCAPCDAQPDRCAGQECGPDGCGGSCGACGEHETCAAGRCVPEPWCGDGLCDGYAAGEDCERCPADCACGCGETCRRGACEFTGCEGRTCGDDGCGGSCGTCGCGEACVAGACVFEGCRGIECGFDTAGCGVPCGPGCDPCHEACVEGRCEWVDRCEGRTCGSDGCGGSCGTCACGESCEDGACVAEDRCEGRTCGPDGCGGTCGECLPGSYCDGGRCVSACEGTVCGAPGFGPLACCTGAEVCVGFECCRPDAAWVCLDDQTRVRVDGCGNPSETVERCPDACDPATGRCVPCAAVCPLGVCENGRCLSPQCGDGRCDGARESCATCPDDCGAGDGCAPGSVQTTRCAPGGQKERRCDVSCRWSEWSACGALGAVPHQL